MPIKSLLEGDDEPDAKEEFAPEAVKILADAAAESARAVHRQALNRTPPSDPKPPKPSRPELTIVK